MKKDSLVHLDSFGVVNQILEPPQNHHQHKKLWSAHSRVKQLKPFLLMEKPFESLFPSSISCINLAAESNQKAFFCNF